MTNTATTNYKNHCFCTKVDFFKYKLVSGTVPFLIACRLDLLLGATFIRDATVIAYCGNELISITENIGLIGVPLPQPIKQAISALHDKEEN